MNSFSSNSFYFGPNKTVDYFTLISIVDNHATEFLQLQVQRREENWKECTSMEGRTTLRFEV